MKVRIIKCNNCEYDSCNLDCQACYACDNGSNFKQKKVPFDMTSPRNIIAMEMMKALLRKGDLSNDFIVVMSAWSFEIADAFIEEATKREKK